ncbi:MAG: carotenoid oxygenase family protein, partial [Streptosporangiaceae bacterium]
HKIIFNEEQPARFGVIPRRGAAEEIRWFEAEPCYIYHVVNSYEQDDEIVLDVCRVMKPEPSGEGGPLARMLSYLRMDAHLYRYRFDLATGRTREDRLDDDNTEFPLIAGHLVGRPHRYSYNVHISAEKTLLFDGLVKYDLSNGSRERFDFGPGRWGSETPFAQRTGRTGEDDGYLLSFVQDERDGRSEVVIIDAQTLDTVGRVRLPQRVPIGFHATWVRGDRLTGGLR